MYGLIALSIALGACLSDSRDPAGGSEKFYKTTCFGEIASTDYEGEIAGYGAQVKIRTIPDVTVSDYVIGAGLGAQYPTSNSVTLAIDQAKSFNVALSTVDMRQSDVDMADVFANDGSIQLRIAADADVLQTIPPDVSADNQGTTAGVDSNDINLGDSTTPRSVASTSVPTTSSWCHTRPTPRCTVSA